MIKITSLNDLFELAQGLERYAHELYSAFATMFPDHPEAVRIFSELADDEQMHELELEKTRSRLSEEQLRQPGDAELVHKAMYLAERSVEKILPSVRSLSDAIQVAQDLENSEVNQLFRLLTTKSIDSEVRRQFVDRVISQHLSRLEGFKTLEKPSAIS